MGNDEVTLERRGYDPLIQICNTKHDDLDRRLVNMEEAIEKLRDRLPVWATLLMTGMGTVIGAFAGHAFR